MHKVLYFFTLILLLFSSFVASAQTMNVRHFNTETGLPTNDIWCVEPDDKGFLWFGSIDGLFRFDGYSYHRFNLADHRGPAQMMIKGVSRIHRILGHYVLCRNTANQIACYDTDRNTFVEFLGTYRDSIFPNVRFDTDYLLFHLASGNALKVEVGASEKLEYTLLENMPYRDTLYVKNRLLDLTDTGKTVLYDNCQNPVITETNNDTLWYVDRFGTGDILPIKVFEAQRGEITYNRKYRVCTDPVRQLVWISTGGCGITLYDKRRHKTIRFGQTMSDHSLLKTNYINGISLDEAGNLWAAQEYNGLAYLMHPDEEVVHILLDETSSNTEANMVDAVVPLPSPEYFGVLTRDGKFYLVDSHLDQKPLLQLSNLELRCYMRDSEGRYWFGSRFHGLYVGKQQYLHSDSDPSTIADNFISHIIEDSRHRIWLAVRSQGVDLARFDASGQLHFRHFPFPGHRVERLFCDSQQRFWAATDQGIYRFDPEADGRWFTPLLRTETISGEVNCIFEGTDGHLFVGTLGQGVLELATDGDSVQVVRSYTMKEGLISNNVRNLQMDNQGRLWMATTQGITVLDPATGSYQYLLFDQQPLRNNYRPYTSLLLPDGRIVMGSIQGINVFDPERLHTEVKPARLKLTDLLVNGVSGVFPTERVAASYTGGNDTIRLTHRQNSLTFRFSTFDYSSAISTRYSYYLEGADHEWSEMSTTTFVSYRNLKPDEYRLHVRAMQTNTGSTDERSFIVIISPPWWLSGWAITLWCVLFLLVATLVTMYIRTLLHLRREIDLERSMTEYKLRFFTDVSHEFRSPLTIMKGALDGLVSGRSLPDSAHSQLGSLRQSVDRMSRLINQLLIFRKVQTDTMPLAVSRMDVVPLLRQISDNFSALALAHDIDFRFLPQDNSLVTCCDPDIIDKVIYNLLSNAFKYTPDGGKISLVARMVGEEDRPMLHLWVTDNGQGVPEELRQRLFKQYIQHRSVAYDSMGIGLHLSFQLVRLHHGSIHYEPQPEGGSQFEVILPASSTDYALEEFSTTPISENTARVEEKTVVIERGMIPQPYNDKTVLVVDDDESLLSFIGQQLQPYFRVITALSVQEAVESLQQGQSVDLILTDLKLGRESGLELIRRVRSVVRLHHIPIVMLTGDTSETNHLKALEAGVDAFLTKPYSLPLLLTTCSQLMTRRQSPKAEPEQRPVKVVVNAEEHDFRRRLKAVVDAHLMNANLTVDMLAEKMGVSRNGFYQQVRELTGQTPNEYLRQQRIEHACQLLLGEPTLSIAEVAYSVGISDAHYFSSLFKAQMGMTPRQYRTQHKPD